MYSQLLKSQPPALEIRICRTGRTAEPGRTTYDQQGVVNAQGTTTTYHSQSEIYDRILSTSVLRILEMSTSFVTTILQKNHHYGVQYCSSYAGRTSTPYKDTKCCSSAQILYLCEIRCSGVHRVPGARLGRVPLGHDRYLTTMSSDLRACIDQESSLPPIELFALNGGGPLLSYKNASMPIDPDWPLSFSWSRLFFAHGAGKQAPHSYSTRSSRVSSPM